MQEVEGVEAGCPLAATAKLCGRFSKSREQPLDPFAQTSGLFGLTPLISLTRGYDQPRGFEQRFVVSLRRPTGAPRTTSASYSARARLAMSKDANLLLSIASPT